MDFVAETYLRGFGAGLVVGFVIGWLIALLPFWIMRRSGGIGMSATETQSARPRKLSRSFILGFVAGAVLGLGALLVVVVAISSAEVPASLWPSLVGAGECGYEWVVAEEYRITTGASPAQVAAAYANRLADEGWQVGVRSGGTNAALTATRDDMTLDAAMTVSGTAVFAHISGDGRCQASP